jgi:Immunoglobulin-like domain of bacterial spore germination
MMEGEAVSPQHPATEPRGRGHGKLTLTIVLILGIAVGIALVLAIESWQQSEDDNLVTIAPTTPPAADTLPPITPSPPAPDADNPLGGAVWPSPDSETRYTDPVEAARGFAVEFVGFTDPLLGEFLVADSRSGEVEVKPSENGPTTIVFLRKLGDDDNWWVLGSVSQNVIVQRPTVRAIIDSPVTVSGQSKSFEGNVQIELRADGAGEPLVAGSVSGGAEELGPFEGSFEFTDPGSGGGALLATVPNAEDGGVLEAVVMRVFFDAD